MKEAIRKAEECGYGVEYALYDPSESSMPSEIWEERYRALLDPLFWQALGKAEEWVSNCNDHKTAWEHYWHKFIDHLAEGKDIDSFFNNLLKK